MQVQFPAVVRHDKFPDIASIAAGLPRTALAWLLFAFWVVFFVIITRITLFPDMNSKAWAAADAIAILAFLWRPAPILAIASRTKLLLTWPVLAITSAIWSDSFTLTAYHGTQFALSFLVGFVFYYYTGLWRILQIVSAYLFSLQVASLAMILVRNGAAFDLNGAATGLFQHKNELGMFSSLQIMVCIPMLMQPVRTKMRAYAISAILLSLFLLAASRSGTGIVATSVILAAWLALTIMRQGMAAIGILVGAGLALLATLALGVITTNTDPIEFVLSLLGKDPTLTGRSILWELGMQSIQENLVLGVGFLAYWHSIEASYLRYVAKEDLLSFHNTFVEVAVAFGVVGLTLFVATQVQQILRGLKVAVHSPSAAGIWPLLYFLWAAAYCTSEWPLFLNAHTQLLYTIAAAAACGVASAAERARPRSG